MDFRGGYYSDVGVKIITEWLNEQSVQLKEVNLQSSQITEKSFPKIKELLDKFPEVIIDLSCNHISIRRFRKYFQNNPRVIVTM